MTVKINVAPDYALSEVKETLSQALANEAEIARFKMEHFRKLCQKFEERFGMTSDEFLKRFEQGELGDAQEYFDWFAAKRGFDLWVDKFLSC
ncbi:MAG TPA: hypothetical protein ENG33_06045 [Chloroflexi bacterium]|nr:hypothetical protein [Chloroflexota bacterium]